MGVQGLVQMVHCRLPVLDTEDWKTAARPISHTKRDTQRDARLCHSNDVWLAALRSACHCHRLVVVACCVELV